MSSSIAVEEFLHNLYKISDSEILFAYYQDFIKKQFGIDRVVYSFLNDHYLIGQKTHHGVFSNYPDEWISYYQEKDYFNSDPVVKTLFRVNTPFLWKDLHKHRELSGEEKLLMSEADEIGLHNGVAVPLHGIRGEVAGIGLAFSDRNIALRDDTSKMLLGLMTQSFHHYYCTLITDQDVFAPKLTVKEMEILQWLAVGKTANEIATIHAVSHDTVKFHVKNIYDKLEANSKTLAVLKALRLGLVELEKWFVM